LELTVYEQRPYARWGDHRLVNREGRIFGVAGAGSIQGLPQLSGPDDRLEDVIGFYAECLREFSGSGLVVTGVTLSDRGSWRLTLVNGAVIEVGREDAEARLKRFLDVWPKLAAGSGRIPAYVDLRYENGFALRWAAPATPPQPGTGNGKPGAGQATTPTALLVPPFSVPHSLFPAVSA
ncbi:MAG: cell division protein FtsQ/DivIB, partial [Candidatus Dormibacteria bacterium]